VSNPPRIPKRFSIVDETTWDEYFYIGPGDDCFYIWERMSNLWKSGQRPDYSKYPTNGFISNFQIPVVCKTDNPFRYKHKIAAIKHAAEALGKLVSNDLRTSATFVPIPPSKTKDDPEYDARLLKALKAVRDPPLADVRELVLQNENVDSKQKGLSPEDRASNYYVNEDAVDPEPRRIVVFDDVLTTGSHFKAMKLVLSRRLPEVQICGLFLARAVRPQNDDDDNLLSFVTGL
jgi:hypothetical protein